MRPIKNFPWEEFTKRVDEGATNEELRKEFQITRLQAMYQQMIMWKRRAEWFKATAEREAAEGSAARHQLTQLRELHNRTRDDIHKLSQAATVLLEHPLMGALVEFAETGKPDYKIKRIEE